MKESVKNVGKESGTIGKRPTQRSVFEKGREYEKQRHRIVEALWLGYGSLLFGIIMLFGAAWDWKTRIIYVIILAVFGSVNLYIGYSLKKEQEKNEK